MVRSENDETSLEQVKKANLTRETVYAFLSRGFKAEVDCTYLTTMEEIQPILEVLSDSQKGEDMIKGYKLLRKFTAHVNSLKDGERQDFMTDLAAEYASLFLGVGQNPVHLMESVYLGKDHLLYEKPYHEILAAYRSLGFEKEKGFPEPEDHVAVEFEFMANMCRWTIRSLECSDVRNAITYLNLQKEFLNDHILAWAPEMSKRLRETATSDLYKALAHLTKGFVMLDGEVTDHLGEVLRNKALSR